METFDAIKEAGHLADLSNTKQSTDVSDYYLSSVQQQAANLPAMSYGLQLNRLADAPPTDLVDTESHLKNQFDILSKSGYVYKRNHATPLPAPETAALTQPSQTVNAKDFFNPISGRDFNKFSKKSCNDLHFLRDDISMVKAPVPTRFDHVDTRALTKDKIDSCAK